MRYRRTVARSIAGLGLLAMLAACGGGTVQGEAAGVAASIQAAIKANQPTDGAEQPRAEAAEVTEQDTTLAPSTEAAPPPLTRAIGKIGWYDGFAIMVDEITASHGFGNNVDLEVGFSYQNLSNETNTPAEASIQVDGEVAEAFFDTPGIPGGGSARGTAEFTVSPAGGGTGLTYDDAIDLVTVVYGDAGDNQTTIPLATESPVDSVEPVELAATGTMTQGEIVVEVVGGTLAPSYESGEKGKSLVNLRISLSCATGCSQYGYNTNLEEFSLTGPDGNSVTADSRSAYCCDALYPGTVSDDERNILTFVVQSPGTGDYTVTYQNPSLTAAGTAAATFGFTT